MKDEIVEVEKLLDQFGKEEIGNKLSQFAFLALKSLLLDILRNKKE